MMNNSAVSQPGSSSVVGARVVRDDRIFPEIRVIGAIIVLVLVVASAILYLMPDRTKEFFAWGINPTMTPMLMGAGYLSGAWFFIRTCFESKWHHVGWGFLAITTFTWFMGIATILHWDKFTPGHISFIAWAFLYFLTPFLVPFLWWRNRVTDPGTPDPDDVTVAPPIRQFSLVAGGIMLLIALFLFILPDVAINIWPWKLTPLTARVVAGWFALPAIVGIVLSREPRWSSWRILLESQIIALVLILVAVARAWDQFDTGKPTTWVFVGGIAALLACVVALFFYEESRRRRALA